MRIEFPLQSWQFPGFSLILLLFFSVYVQLPAFADGLPDLSSNPPDSLIIKGKVTDEDGLPLPGVSVSVKDSKRATATNQQGAFSIAVHDRNNVLIFSHVLYRQQEASVKGSNVLNIIMIKTLRSMDEVVVIGYGKVSRKDLTGSVSQVDMKDLAKAPVKSFDEALAGRVAGVVVSGNDGSPGSLNNIVIRGGNSITQDNSPLYVVDGFPMEATDFNSINPADIETIDVLKDASATAIYGARGANGVIMITTKSGIKGIPVVSYGAYYGNMKISKKMKMMDPYEFVKYQTEYSPPLAASYIPGALDPSDTSYRADGKTLDYYRNAEGINWQDLVFRTGTMQNHDIAIRGGNDRTTYAISGNIMNQNAIFLNTGFKRYQGRVVLNQTLNPKVKTGINLNYAYTNITGQQFNPDESNGSLNLMFGVMGYRPVTGKDNDNLLDDLVDPEINSTNYSVNPLINAQNAYNANKQTSLIANGFLEYNISRSLAFKSTLGVTSTATTLEVFNNSKTLSGNPQSVKGNNGSVGNVKNDTWLNENYLTYRKTINDHKFNVVAGFSLQSNEYSYRSFEGRLLPNESLKLDGLDEAITQITTSSSRRWTMASFLGRINYDFKSKYLLTASFRTDGSSRFTNGNQWASFPSASVAWRMSAENFMKKLTFINDAKLRFGYGTTGNNRIREFSYLSQLRFAKTDAYSYNNATPSVGVGLSLLGNPDLVWETTGQYNAGVDLSLFNSRVSLVADIYRKTTWNLLLLAQLPYTTGLTESYKNIGKMRNEGVEFTVNTINIQKKKNFSWNSSINISFNRNKVLALTDNQNSKLSTARFDSYYNGLFSYIAVVGAPVAQMHGLIWEGNYQYPDFNRLPNGRYLLKDNIPYYGSVREDIQPGDIKYRDINGDLVVDAKDYTAIGRALPVHTGGFTNNFTYKDFDLNIFIQWSYGNDILNANRLIFEGNGRRTTNLNQFASYEDRWTPENTSSVNFRANGMGPVAISSRVVEDGSYARLKTVSLGYNVKPALLKKIRFKTFRIYASAQNLITLTHYTGYDPEVSIRNSPLTPGFDYAPYPRARTYVFGINTSF